MYRKDELSPKVGKNTELFKTIDLFKLRYQRTFILYLYDFFVLSLTPLLIYQLNLDQELL